MLEFFSDKYSIHQHTLALDVIQVLERRNYFQSCTIPSCVQQLSLIWTASRRLDSLAYIECTTDAYSQYIVNDTTSLLMWCPSHLQGKLSPILRNNAIYFHMHISIAEFVIPLCCRVSGCSSCTCKEYSKNIQFMTTCPYYNPTTSPVVNF